MCLTHSIVANLCFKILNCCSLTKVVTEMSEEHESWKPKHTTGSARSEGFYKISRKDKMKYLHVELPPTSTQVLIRLNDLSAQFIQSDA